MKRAIFLCGLIFAPLIGFSQSYQVLDSVVVDGNRAGKKTPVTHTTLSKRELSSSSPSNSLPMILALQPSVISSTEGGTGLGYSDITIRGSDATRINFTLNGVAMNDPESQKVFWVNIPSIDNMLQSVQIQRGIGTSVNGPGAFGATVNMQTIFPSTEPYGGAEFGMGSYRTFTSRFSAGTGRAKSGLSFDLMVSRNTTDGYIRNAKADVLSLFASVGYNKNSNYLKLNYIMGSQKSGITWEGISWEKVESDRRYNPAGEYYDDAGNVRYYDNETDNYRQHLLQLLYTKIFSDKLAWTTVAAYTKGDGYYENYKADKKFSDYGLDPQLVNDVEYKRSDILIQQSMDNSYYVLNSTLKYSDRRYRSSTGLSYSYYTGDHFGDVIWSKYNQNIPEDYQWYLNNGVKQDFSIFSRHEYDMSNSFTLFADLQYRFIDYSLSGIDKDFTSLDKALSYNFFNPKGGVNYVINRNNRIYASLSMGHKEPSRGDIKEAIKAGTEDRMTSERLLDYEVGYSFTYGSLNFNANLYFMEYKDQLVQTGKLSETGYAIKENVPVSYRRGVELSAAWQPFSFLRLDGNMTLSRNRIEDYTAWVDTKGVDGSYYQTPEHYENTNIILSPEIIGMGMISFYPSQTSSISLYGKYVGKRYYDNTSNEERSLPAYFVAGLNASKEFGIRGSSRMRVSLHVDNLFNNRYIAGGWVYRMLYEDGSAPYIEEGLYPQAEINFMCKIAFVF